MTYYFDIFGWYTREKIEGRVTNIKPENLGETTIEGELRSNFTGTEWVNVPYFTHKDPEPEPELVPGQPKKITQLAFISRFTDAEAIALDLASIGATVEAASIRRYMQKVDAATFIDLELEDTITGVNQLEAVGLIGAGRANVILTAPITEQEIAR